MFIPKSRVSINTDLDTGKTVLAPERSLGQRISQAVLWGAGVAAPSLFGLALGHSTGPAVEAPPAPLPIVQGDHVGTPVQLSRVAEAVQAAMARNDAIHGRVHASADRIYEDRDQAIDSALTQARVVMRSSPVAAADYLVSAAQMENQQTVSVTAQRAGFIQDHTPSALQRGGLAGGAVALFELYMLGGYKAMEYDPEAAPVVLVPGAILGLAVKVTTDSLGQNMAKALTPHGARDLNEAERAALQRAYGFERRGSWGLTMDRQLPWREVVPSKVSLPDGQVAFKRPGVEIVTGSNVSKVKDPGFPIGNGFWVQGKSDFFGNEESVRLSYNPNEPRPLPDGRLEVDSEYGKLRYEDPATKQV